MTADELATDPTADPEVIWQASLRGPEHFRPTRKLTPQEYLRLERPSEFRSELVDGDMMAIETEYRRSEIKMNLMSQVHPLLRDGPFTAFSSNQRVTTGQGSYFYPDIVFFETHQVDPLDPDTLATPLAILEVMSTGAEEYVRTRKFGHYQQIASLAEYLVVDQDRASVAQHVRQDDGSWSLAVHIGEAQRLRLASVPVAVSLADLYHKYERKADATASGRR